MIRCAFYAPLKSPNHPVPSGDRTVARAIIAALEYAGYHVALAAEFSCRDGAGDEACQQALINEAALLKDKIVDQGRSAGWQVWITYHNYYKAPDLLGPDVAKALGIPYVLIEATRARKRLVGPWAQFAQLAEAASDSAATIFYLTHRDAEALIAYAPPDQRHVQLRPFLPTDSLPPESYGSPRMLSVGMFRQGDKLASYKLIAEVLALLKTPDWTLAVAGDGPARSEVETALADHAQRIEWLGHCNTQQLAVACTNSGILLWPGVNEAFGMAYLEAQAAGLVAVAQDRPGVRDVLAPVLDRPTPDAGADALAQQLDDLLQNPEKRRAAGQQSRDYVAGHHLLAAASKTLDTELKALLK